jgi:two-component system nitrate/nitrite sensor histidine kinase NarX
VTNGFAAPWLDAQAAHYMQLVVVMVALSTLAYVALVISFLDLRRRVRWAYRILVAVAVVAAGAAVIGLVVSPRFGFAILLAGTPVLLVVTLIGTVIGVRQGSRPAIYFLVAQLLPIVLGLLQSTAILGLAPWSPPLVTSVPTSELLLIVLMSLALADRVNIMRNEAERANRELAASEKRLADYLDALPFGIVVHDSTLKPTYANRSLRDDWLVQSTRFDHEEVDRWLQEHAIVVTGTGEPYPQDRMPLMRAAAGERAHADDLAVDLPRGRIPIEVWSSPLVDAAGKVTAIISAFEDISARRAVENELASYRDHLEQRVAVRTAELAAANTTLQARVSELSAINEISQAVAHLAEPRWALQHVLTTLADLFGTCRASISLFAAEDKEIEVVGPVRRGHDEEHREEVAPTARMRIPFDPETCHVTRLTEPVVIRDLELLRGLPDQVRADLAAQGGAQLLLAPLQARQQMFGVIALAALEPEFSFSANDLDVVQTIAAQVAAALDVRRLLAEARRQRDMADALRRTTTALSRSLDQSNVLGTILEQLRQVFDYEGAAVALVEANELVIVDARGLSAQHLGRRTALAADSASVRVLRSGRPATIFDTHDFPALESWDEPREIRSWVGAPLVTNTGVIGVLNLDSTQVHAFTQGQADLLMTFADQAAIAVVNARLYVQAQASAAAVERDRIARDLHDAVTQTLFSASLVAAALPHQIEHIPPAALAQVALLQTLTRGALAEMRTLLLELRPEHLVEAKLDVLLAQLADAFTGRMGIPVLVTANADPAYRPPADVKVVFYRVAQEALNNIAKHAGATRVTINCSIRQNALRLTILDDGCGFDPHAVRPERLGLAIMRERAAEIGAELVVDSEPGHGTRVFLTWSQL